MGEYETPVSVRRSYYGITVTQRTTAPTLLTELQPSSVTFAAHARHWWSIGSVITVSRRSFCRSACTAEFLSRSFAAFTVHYKVYFLLVSKHLVTRYSAMHFSVKTDMGTLKIPEWKTDWKMRQDVIN